MQYIDKRTKPCPFCGWEKQSVMTKTYSKYMHENYDFNLADGDFRYTGTDCCERVKIYIKCNKCHAKSRSVDTATLKNIKWSSNIDYDYNKHCYIKKEPPEELTAFVDKAVEYWNMRPTNKRGKKDD